MSKYSWWQKLFGIDKRDRQKAQDIMNDERRHKEHQFGCHSCGCKIVSTSYKKPMCRDCKTTIDASEIDYWKRVMEHSTARYEQLRHDELTARLSGLDTEETK